jgi:hypothetical protein
MHKYRVIDLRNPEIEHEERMVSAASPEAAARHFLGTEVVRSGARKNLIARVYWQNPNQPLNMVRLYSRDDAGAVRQ